MAAHVVDDDPFYLTPAPAAAPEPAPLPVTKPALDHRLLPHKYGTIEQFMEEFQAWANKEGFSVKKARSNNCIKNFGASQVDISCLQDKIRPSEAHSRKTETIKQDCGFKAVATALGSNDRK
jgi:hypothetical protein